MPTVVGPFELDYNGTGRSIDAQEVDPPVCVLKSTELLSYDQKVVSEQGDVVLEHGLEIPPFEHSFIGEGCRIYGFERTLGHVEEWHLAMN